MNQLRVLSLGWGVQSWTLAAMAALGEIEPIDYAVHADTTFEMSGTYDHAASWTPWLEDRGVKVVTVKAEPEPSPIQQGTGAVMMPAYTLNKDGTPTPIRRQCTNRWKIQPIRRFIRSHLTGKPQPNSVELIMGISWDESYRMKDPNVKYIKHVYPLIDKRMKRMHCIQWLQEHELTVPPKSTCTFCPYHSIDQWKQLKSTGDDNWNRAVAVDEIIRSARKTAKTENLFIHKYCLPLAEAVNVPEDFGAKQLGFANEDLTCDSGFCFT